jgi:hypothetical protein
MVANGVILGTIRLALPFKKRWKSAIPLLRGAEGGVMHAQ